MNTSEHFFAIVHSAKPKKFCSWQQMKTINHLFTILCNMTVQNCYCRPSCYSKILHTLKQRINKIKHLFTLMYGTTETSLPCQKIIKTSKQRMKVKHIFILL